MTSRHCVLILLIASTLAGCNRAPETQAQAVELKHFPLDSMEDVRAASGVSFDAAVSADGHGSLRVDAAAASVIPLFEVTDVQIDDARLVYQADMQSENLKGQSYLEMWVRIPGKGEFFSRGLNRQLTGTMSWATIATPFFLEAGQTPDLIRLDLVVNGTGTVWIDDIRLLRLPLE